MVTSSPSCGATIQPHFVGFGKMILEDIPILWVDGSPFDARLLVQPCLFYLVEGTVNHL